ncbi:MAG: helix-turn-helix domain-containing protein [Dehalococcoidia bacterium]|nr:helix-turn-helix domain-containing protein [Dehalococcoidia bacterium]
MPRERNMLKLVAAGLGDRQIAALLDVKLRTVQSRLRRFSERTAIGGSRTLVSCAVRHEECCLANRLANCQ